MPENITDHSQSTDRRGFLGRAATATAMLGVAATATALREAVASPLETQAADGWLNGLKGKYRQVFDGHEPNDGFPLAFAHTFLATQGPKPDAGAVVVLRHGGFVLALGDAAWSKYKIGATLNIIDPATKAPAVRNPFLRPNPGVLLADDMAIDKLLGRGVLFGGCNVALQVLSGRLAGNAGVTADVALKDWTAAVIPGVVIIPSGVWGINRAQMAGCTYCVG